MNIAFKTWEAAREVTRKAQIFNNLGIDAFARHQERNSRRIRREQHCRNAAFQRINVAFSRAQNLLVIVGARNMYADQPVVIPDLNTGEERTTKVYRQIIEKLYQKNAYFTGDDVIPAATALKILEKLG